MSYTPDQPNIYHGKQVIINSDRLLFNAKDDSVLLIANKAIAFNTQGTINFDTGTNPNKNKVIINSPNIHLGLKINERFAPPTEPAVLGDKLETVLNMLLDFLEFDLQVFLSNSYKLKVPGGSTAGITPETSFATLEKSIGIIRKILKDFKSDTVKLT
tara:strand:+ start:3121 stop:3594 length:474 start_codon:yes stop_codon:yes gene_type:complete